jgi:hypothetical protein
LVLQYVLAPDAYLTTLVATIYSRAWIINEISQQVEKVVFLLIESSLHQIITDNLFRPLEYVSYILCYNRCGCKMGHRYCNALVKVSDSLEIFCLGLIYVCHVDHMENNQMILLWYRKEIKLLNLNVVCIKTIE